MMPSENTVFSQYSASLKKKSTDYITNNFHMPTTRQQVYDEFNLHTLHVDLLSIMINHYINRLSRCIHAQKKLRHIVKTALTLSNNEPITKIALKKQWRITNHHAFNHWTYQLKTLLCQLHALTPSSEKVASYYSINHYPTTTSVIREPQQEFVQPLYLILTGTLEWPIADIRSLASLWTTNRIEKGHSSTTHCLLSSPIDLMLIDIDYQDQESLQLCHQLRHQHFTTPILGIITDNQEDAWPDIEKHCQLTDINDYCRWPLKNKPWQTWFNHWLPNQTVTLRYVKRIK